MSWRWWLTCLAVGLMGASVRSAATVDLASLELKNRFQQEVVTNIVGSALARDGNQFLVLVDAQQQSLLTQAGIPLQIIKADLDISQYALVRQNDHLDASASALKSLGETVPLGRGLFLATMDASTARELSKTVPLSATPLGERRVPFTYIPVTVSIPLRSPNDLWTDTLVDLVRQDTIYAMNVRLENFQTRYIYTDSINAARDWLVNKFMSWGYTDVSAPSFWYDGGWRYNVMCVKPGYAEPDKVIVVGGHYDSVVYGEEPGPMVYAPGSDDDASGTVVTLELARILAAVPCRKTIIFMPFTAEEQGLVGSWVAAENFANSGTDLEAMFNYDMIGYVEQSSWPLNIASGPVTAYKNLSIDAANRLTDLTPINAAMGSSSDHYSFFEHGFPICDNIEGDFNTAGWHTNLDLTSRMNFDFMTDVIKTALASVAYVANAAHITGISQVMDLGDGNAVEVFWESCEPNYQYSVLYGAQSGVYTDTIPVAPGNCSQVVGGLNDGQEYYFAVMGTTTEAYPPLYLVEQAQTSYLIPRPPSGLKAGPGDHSVLLDWNDSPEIDLVHYSVYRRVEGFPFSLLADNVVVSQYVDSEVVGGVSYTYAVTSVDDDGYESEKSASASSTAATFDNGILIADEWTSGPGSPSQEVQDAFFDTIFGGTPYHVDHVDISDVYLSRSAAAPFSSVFWIDDDVSSKTIRFSEDSLRWYAGFSNDIFIAGFRTLQFWVDSDPVPGDLVYDEFRIDAYADHTAFDFAGATGANGWPDIQVGPHSPFGDIPNIPTLTLRSGAVPIYLYDSRSNNPSSEGKPCAVAYDGPHGKRVLLAFPLYWLTEESARNLISYAVVYFGETGGTEYGDVDGSGMVDIGDLVYFVAYAFQGGPPPPDLNQADVDGSCRVDISDIVYLVQYMFLGGPAPVQGCVE